MVVAAVNVDNSACPAAVSARLASRMEQMSVVAVAAWETYSYTQSLVYI